MVWKETLSAKDHPGYWRTVGRVAWTGTAMMPAPVIGFGAFVSFLAVIVNKGAPGAGVGRVVVDFWSSQTWQTLLVFLVVSWAIAVLLHASKRIHTLEREKVDESIVIVTQLTPRVHPRAKGQYGNGESEWYLEFQPVMLTNTSKRKAVLSFELILNPLDRSGIAQEVVQPLQTSIVKSTGYSTQVEPNGDTLSLDLNDPTTVKFECVLVNPDFTLAVPGSLPYARIRVTDKAHQEKWSEIVPISSSGHRFRHV